ncbi:MAG TPA: radical SAM protein, partial [Treponemataceae bacterium]|nr:radical SAM protein [Treponemataceae bacterium]
MTTTLIKFALSGRLSPFTFKKAPNFLPDTGTLDYGLYVHIPFCRTICPFCPYYKTLYDESLMADYAEALLLEIETASMRADKPRGKATTLYFGGGSPALAAPYLTRVMERFRSNFGFDGHAGIELHPRDATNETLSAVKAAGIDMVSLGAQSFQPKLLDALDRGQSSPLEALRRIAGYGFTAVDVDLIFGIPGQTDADLAEDFRIAARNGATQISTYPFIDFSYANNRRKPLGRGDKKRMLRTLAEVSEAEGFARTSVWTFGKAAAPRYSSITRDNFLGFGPSATSL